MRKQMIGWLTAGLLLSGTAARAQGFETVCLTKPMTVTAEAWSHMTAQQQVTACELDRIGTPPTKKQRSTGLAQGGMASILVGISMIVGYGTTYHVLGNDVCVSQYSIDAGSCRSNSALAKYGSVAIGAGVAMMWIGNQKVAIKPTVTPTQKSVTAQVSW